MGLSRNKVAVSEGAAGSPPFYGEPTDLGSKAYESSLNSDRENLGEHVQLSTAIAVRFSMIDEIPTRGCSSVGRAPALQAGGHGFESHHLHQKRKLRNKAREDEMHQNLHGLIAQVVRARA